MQIVCKYIRVIMKKKKVSTSIVLDTRRPLNDGTYPVKLRLTYQRKQKYYQAINKKGEPYTYIEAEFDKVRDPKARGSYKDENRSLVAIEDAALQIIEKLPVFSFEAFEKKYLIGYSKDDVFSAFNQLIERLTQDGRAGTASSYNCAYKSLKNFTGSDILPFASVTVDFLHAYERWMLDSDKSITTVGIYLRALRAVYNDAISSGDAHKDSYPFEKRKYVIPAGRNVKKALSLSEIEKIFNYEPAHEGEEKARDFWVFSYMCNGINVKDMARLKYENIVGDEITFIRAKTERTSRQNIKPIVAILTPETKSIIERWGNKPKKGDNYVFPILTKGLSPVEELAKVRYATKAINKYIKRIALAVGIEKNVSTYYARHSFSTVLKQSGASMELISESLGHSNLKTTQSYLDSFEKDIKKQFAARLTNFGKGEQDI
jgi:integrase/recombinase XerD